MAYSQTMIEGGSTRIGRWLRERRLRLALWVAVVEGLLVALTPDLTKWTVLVIGAILLAFYIVAGRNMRWDVARQLSWIAAASQALAILVVILAFVLKLVAIVAVIIFALVALAYLFSDSRHT
jgi:apolipoprotein N-acyltransferase